MTSFQPRPDLKESRDLGVAAVNRLGRQEQHGAYVKQFGRIGLFSYERAASAAGQLIRARTTA
jgi:hypothetical protein